ncbi:MAG: PAS domain-containing sensor histidine kinase [Elusimicrobia bacterium]|nr:PAS domain-containing sensor histidine kinase [Elusimicrobiota bacterium]
MADNPCARATNRPPKAQARARVEELLDPLFRNLSDGISVCDSKGAVLYMNPAARRLLGVELEVRSLNICSYLCENLKGQGVRCPLQAGATDQDPVVFQGRFAAKTKFAWKDFHIQRSDSWKEIRLRCERLSTSLFGDQLSDARFIFIEDASAELELQQRKEDWRSMIAHDLRTPLSAIHGALHSLDDIPAGRPLDEQEQALVRLAARNTDRMLELLNLYLEVAQLDSGTARVELVRVPLKQLAKKVAEDQRPLADEKSIALAVNIPEELHAKADNGLLSRMLENLVNNAIKFTSRAGRITVGGAGTSEEAQLWVEDTGSGIAPRDIPHIFDRFYQARARRENRIQGNGLGLTFCREAAKSMGASVEVESRLGQGSRFTIRLPKA